MESFGSRYPIRLNQNEKDHNKEAVSKAVISIEVEKSHTFKVLNTSILRFLRTGGPDPSKRPGRADVAFWLLRQPQALEGGRIIL